MSSGRLTALLILCYLGIVPADAQTSAKRWTVRVGGGLGVALVSMPRLADYVNSVATPQNPSDDFASAAELFMFGEIGFADDWSAGFYWGRISKTIEPGGSVSGGWRFDATMTMPIVFLRHAIDAGAMRFELLGGAGPVHGELQQRYGSLGSEQQHTGLGVGLLAGVSAFAPLDDHLVAGISADVRWSGVGELKDSAGRAPVHRTVTADLQWFHVSLQFLVAVQL